MTSSASRSGVAIAAAAAALFALGAAQAAQPMPAADQGSMAVHCTGANACKGQSECASAKNQCKGQNACKGQGWINKKSAEECTAAGGKVGM